MFALGGYCRAERVKCCLTSQYVNCGFWVVNSFTAVGADADEDRIELLLSQVKGKDTTELIAAGMEKLASVPSGGGASAGPAASGGAAPAAESKKEEKVEEKEESDDVKFPLPTILPSYD
ncbi:unnamed protein product [Linum tenue]|uniref:60S acidic ribosomal protein P2 n=1 Tax=Linum tenue TaxID=586396 RepID=A0AAV0QJE9_9ROSI|nr:unnamed protein product [Linum tenue]